MLLMSFGVLESSSLRAEREQRERGLTTPFDSIQKRWFLSSRSKMRLALFSSPVFFALLDFLQPPTTVEAPLAGSESLGEEEDSLGRDFAAKGLG